MKGVKNYLKNVTKSAVYYASDIAKDELMPNVGDFATTNADFIKTAYQTIRNPKTAAKKVVDQVANSKVYEALDYGAKNLFEDLKTGNFYNKERLERDQGKFAGLDAGDFNDLSEFGIDDDWEENLGKDSDEDITAGDLKIVEAVEGSNKALASSTANAVISSANATIKSQRIGTGILYQQNEKLFGGLHNDISVLNATMDTMLKLQTATFQNIDKNLSDYFTSSLKLQTENNAILKEMLEMQRNQYKAMQQEDEARKNKSRGARYSDVTSGGIPDFAAYFENMQNNIAKKIKESTNMPDFSSNGEGNMFKEFFVNPMEFIVKPIISSAIPNIVKQSAQELDKTIAGLFGQAMGALTNAKNDNPDGLLGKIADFIGVRTSINKNIDVGKYHKGPVPFDGVTRKAIIEVIPAYLRRIEASLSGRPETMFDYDTGKWISPKDVKKEFDNIRSNAIRQGTSDLRSGMDKYIRQERKSLGVKGVDAQKEFDKAVDEFYQFLYDRNGRFNPAKSADDNKIDSKYTYLRKYYNEIRIIYTNYDIDKSGNKARHTNLSSRIGLANAIMSAKDSEERTYRNLENGSNKFTQYFANGGKFDQHGKWRGDNKDKWEANSMGLLAAVDDKGNNVFNYLQNISKELEWQRTFMSNNGFGGGRVKGNGNGKKLNIPDFNKIDVKRFNSKASDASSLNKDDRALKEAITLIAEGKTIDWTKFNGDEDDAKLLDELAYMIQEQSTEDQRKIKNAARDENFITRIVNKKYETNKDAKKLDEEIEKIVKETVNEKESESDKTESVFNKVMDQANKAKNFFSGLAQAPGEIFADVLYSADRAIYDMMFKNALKEDGEEPEEYKGFMDMLQKKTSKMFNNLGDSLQEKFINPLKEKLGIGDDFGEKTKDSLKKLGTNIMGKVIEANKEVYKPGIDYLNQQFGISEKLKPAESALFNQRFKNRENLFINVSDIHNNDKTLAELIEKGESLGLDTTDKAFRNSTPAKKAIEKEYYKQALKATKDGTEFGDKSQIQHFFKLIVHTDVDLPEIEKIAKNNNIKIKGDNKNEITFNLYKDMLEKYDKDRNDLLNKIKDNRGDKKLTGYFETESFIDTYGMDKLRAGAYENDIKQNAKGTIASIPFKGATMLSKGEMLFNSKGVGVVDKTDAYNLTEPTHILSSYDSNPLLKSMGINPGARRTPEQDLRSENSLKDKLFGKGAGIANHADGSTVRVNGNGSGIDYDLIKENLKQYAPEGIAGGIVGGIVSTLFGVVGGPLVGAAVGAAGNIISNSDSLKDKLFGPMADDNKRHGGLISKDIMDAVNKYAPDTLKYGLAGIIPGLITPLGPLGGMLVGGAVGFLKNNEAFTNKYFGEEGKLTFNDDTKKIIQDLLPGAAKGAAVGTVASFLFGGPFGLLGNAALGAGIGMIGSTEEFKEMILGKDVNGVRSGGLVGALKDLASPLTDSFKKIGNKLIEAFDEGVVDPISRFLTPAIHGLPRLLGTFPRLVSDVIANKIFSEDNFFGRAVRKVANPLIKGATGIATGAINVAKHLNPFQLFGIAGDAMRTHDIKNLNADYMTAKDRVAFMKERGRAVSKFDIDMAAIGGDAPGAISIDQAKDLRNKLLSVTDNSKDLEDAIKKQQKDLTASVTHFSTPNGGKFTDAQIDKLIKYIKSNDWNSFMTYADQCVLTDGSRLTKDDKEILFNGSDGKNKSLFNKFKDLKDLEARKKLVGSYGGKNKGEKFKAAKKAIEETWGKETADKINNIRDLSKFSNNITTELEDRDFGGKAEILSPELEEEKKQTDWLSKIYNALTGIEDGTKEENTDAKDKAQDTINKATNKSINRHNKKAEKRKERVIRELEKNGVNFNELPEDIQEKLINRTDEKLYKEVIGAGPRAAELFETKIENAPGAIARGFKNTFKTSGNLIKDLFGLSLNLLGGIVKGGISAGQTIGAGAVRTSRRLQNIADKHSNAARTNRIRESLGLEHEEENNVEGIEPEVATNGLGTFLLNGAKTVGGLAAKGISKLFGNKEEGGNNKAAGALASLFAAKSAANSNSGSDTEMSGNNVVREDGRTMKMKEDSNGSLVPNTADSNTKQTLNLIAIKEKAQEKLQEAQLKASETIEKIFNPPEGRKKKMGWLGIAIAGAALVKSGLLKKLFDNVIKPIWTDHLKPWITDKAIPWITDTALPALGSIATDIISGLPDALWGAFKTAFPLFEDLLDKIAGNKKKKTKTTKEQLKDGTTFYDANGNAVDKDNLESGVTYTNADGDTVTIDEEGNIIVTPKNDHTYLKKTGKGMARTALNVVSGMNGANFLVKGVNKGLTKLTHSKSLLAKGVGYTGKAFTAPISIADNAATAVVKNGGIRNAIKDATTTGIVGAGDKLLNVTNGISNKALNAGEFLTKADEVLFKGKHSEKIISKATNIADKADDIGKGISNVADNVINKVSSKSSGKIASMIKNIPTVIGDFLNNSTVGKALKEVANFLHIDDFAKWITGFKDKLIKIFTSATKEGAEKAGEAAVKKGAGSLAKVAGKVLGIAMIVLDFVSGMDKAESMLGVQDTTILEEVACGITNALCNLIIIPSIFPGAGKIAQFILEIFGVDLDERQAAAQAEVDKYNEENGTTLTVEEYMEQEKSFGGKIKSKVKKGWNSVKDAAKGGLKGIKTGLMKTGKSIKNAFSRDENGNLNIVESIKNSEFVTKTTDLINKAKETLGSIGSALTAPMNLLAEGKFREYFTFSSEEDKDNPFGFIKTAATASSRLMMFIPNMVGAIGKRTLEAIQKRTGGLANMIKTSWNVFNEGSNLISEGRFGEYFNFRSSSAISGDNPLSKFGTIITATSRIVQLPINLIVGGVKCIADNFGVLLDEGRGLLSSIWGELNGNGSDLLADGELGEYFTMPDVGEGYALSGLHKILVGTHRILFLPANALGSAVKNIARNWDNIIDGCKSLFGNGLFSSITVDGAKTLAEGNLAEYFNFSDPDGDDTNQFSGIRKVMLGAGRILTLPYNLIGGLGINLFDKAKTAFDHIKDAGSQYIKAIGTVLSYANSSKNIEDMDNDDSININTGSPLDGLYNMLLYFPKMMVKMIYPFTALGAKLKDGLGDLMDSAGKGFDKFFDWLGGDYDETETKSGTGKYGRSKFGRAKQIDPRIANMRFNAPGDKTYQTIGDSACGPAAAVTAVQSMYGRSTDPTVQAANFAIKNGYKEKDGGTKPGFFTDYFNRNGLGSSTYTNRSDMEASIRSGNPTVLMGQDKGGVNSSNPYGKNPHYVTATGVDGKGNVIIQDPESKYDDQVYKMDDVLNKSSLGISAYGKGKNYVRASRYGRAKKDVASKVWGFLKSKGFNDEAAAGIMGNLKAESGMDPTSIQGGGKGPAAGICQWENYNTKSGRWKNLYNYAKKRNKEWTDLGTQLNFMLTELNSALKSYSGSGWPKHPYSQYPSTEVGWKDKMDLKKYKKLTNVTNAVKIFSQCFERAGIPHMDNRIKYAKEYLKEFAGKAGDYVDDDDSNTDTNSSSNSFVGILSDMINNSTAAKALGLLTGSNSSNSSDNDSKDDVDNTNVPKGKGNEAQKQIVKYGLSRKGKNQYTQSSNRTKVGEGYSDCSSFVEWCYKKAIGFDPGGWTGAQIENPKMVKVDTAKNKKANKKNLELGDLLFYRGSLSNNADIGHVEMYIGDGKILGHGSGQGPTEKSLSEYNSYRANHYGPYAYAMRYKNIAKANVKSGKGNDVEDKPISKYGVFKDTINNSTNKENKTTIKREITNTISRDAAYSKEFISGPTSGMGTTNNTNKLIETVIEILMTIADNTDKLNTIVSILNDKLGIDVSKELNNKDLTKDTKKKKLRQSLMNQTQANSDIDAQSINFILSSMNALASE